MSVKFRMFNGRVRIRLIGRVDESEIGYFPVGDDGRTYGDQVFDSATVRYAIIWASDVHVSQMVPQEEAAVNPAPLVFDEQVANDPLLTVVTHHAFDYEEIGAAVINEVAIAPRYERDIPVRSYTIRRRRYLYDPKNRRPMFNGRLTRINLCIQYVEAEEEVTVPTFEIASNPTIRLSDIRAMAGSRAPR